VSEIRRANLSKLIVALVAIITALIWPITKYDSPATKSARESPASATRPPIIGVGMDVADDNLYFNTDDLPLAPVLVLAS
jgi:hypothetical protein